MERKLVVVHNMGPIPELGYIAGPVVAPTRIPITTIGKMVSNGKAVYECFPTDPRNKDLRVKLTLENYRNDNFADLRTVHVENKPEDEEPTKKEPATAEPKQEPETVLDAGVETNDVEEKKDGADSVNLDPGQFTPELEIPEVE